MKKIYLVIFSLLIFQLNTLAVEPQKVYLSEAINIALENNIDLETKKIDLKIAKNRILQANRLQNPTLDATYLMGKSSNSEPKQVGVNQTIEINKRGFRKQLAEAYINLVAAKSILNTLEQQKQLQEALCNIAQARVKNKQASEIDVIQAEIALNQLITQINTAKADVQKALAKFNKVINTKEDIVYDSMDMRFLEDNNFEDMSTPAPNTKFPTTEAIVDLALKKRFDIRISKHELDIAQKNLTLITKQRAPDLQLMGGYAYIPGRYAQSDSFEHGVYFGASIVNLPLFYNYTPEINNALLKIRQTELKILSTKNKASKDIRAAYEKFLSATENLNRYEEKIVKGSEHLIDVSVKSYQKGEIDIVSLIVMKHSYKSIIIGYAQALADYYNSWTNVLREINDERFVLTSELL